MDTQLPIREARRMFILTVALRMIFALGALVVVGPLLVHVAPFMLVAILPALFVAGLGLLSWLHEDRSGRILGVALLLDITVLSLRNVPAMAAVLLNSETTGMTLPEGLLVEPFLFTLVPLVIMAWAFGKRGAILGASWAVLIHLVTNMVALHLGLLSPISVWLAFARVLMMCLISLIVSILAQRERRYVAELEQAHQQLRRHTAAMEQLAVSRERNRMARDLHDTLAHSLAALTVHLGALKTLLKHDPEEAVAAADEALAMAKRGLAESRLAIQALREDPVMTLGLVDAIRAELSAFQTRTGIEAHLAIAGEVAELTNEEEAAFFRILEEALSNAESHAQASKVQVRLTYAFDQVALQIQDNGIGFDTAQVSSDRYGVMGMRERAAMIGATFDVTSGAQEGTTVWCVLER